MNAEAAERRRALGRMVQAALLAGVPFGVAALSMVVRFVPPAWFTLVTAKIIQVSGGMNPSHCHRRVSTHLHQRVQVRRDHCSCMRRLARRWLSNAPQPQSFCRYRQWCPFGITALSHGNATAGTKSAGRLVLQPPCATVHMWNETYLRSGQCAARWALRQMAPARHHAPAAQVLQTSRGINIYH